MTKILCYTQNKRVDINYCINECKYAFKQECEPVIGYQQGRADAIDEIQNYMLQNKWIEKELIAFIESSREQKNE